VTNGIISVTIPGGMIVTSDIRRYNFELQRSKIRFSLKMGQDESLPCLPANQIHLPIARLKMTKIPWFIPPEHPVTQIDGEFNAIRSIPRRLDHLESLD
jgi:hypothetical protein